MIEREGKNYQLKTAVEGVNSVIKHEIDKNASEALISGFYGHLVCHGPTASVRGEIGEMRQLHLGHQPAGYYTNKTQAVYWMDVTT